MVDSNCHLTYLHCERFATARLPVAKDSAIESV